MRTVLPATDLSAESAAAGSRALCSSNQPRNRVSGIGRHLLERAAARVARKSEREALLAPNFQSR
jgi:hypothetical protein